MTDDTRTDRSWRGFVDGALLLACALVLITAISLDPATQGELFGTVRIVAYLLTALFMIFFTILSGVFALFTFEYVFQSVSGGGDPTFGVVFLAVLFFLIFFERRGDSRVADG